MSRPCEFALAANGDSNPTILPTTPTCDPPPISATGGTVTTMPAAARG